MNRFPVDELALWHKDLQAARALVFGVRPPLDWTDRNSVRQAHEQILGDFDRDLQDLQTQGAFLFEGRGSEEAHTAAALSMFRRWHIQGRGTSLAALCIGACIHFRLDLSPDWRQSLMIAAVLGEVENNQPYHNNTHYKKVMAQMIRMIAAHNAIYRDTDLALGMEQVALLMIAVCIHDLGHDGKGNTIKGLFQQGRLERRSFELAEPYLFKAGLPASCLDDLRVMILCTDVTPLADPSNPSGQLKAAYRFHFQGEKRAFEKLNLDDPISALEKRPILALLALLLHETDISVSAGLDYTLTCYETSLLRQEMQEDDARPQHVVDFLNAICQRRMLTDAGQELFAGNMARIFALAEEGVRDGNQPFPPPEHSDFLTFHSFQDTSGAGDPRRLN